MKKSHLFLALAASPLVSAAMTNVAHAATCAPYGLIAAKYAQVSAALGPCTGNETADGGGGRIQAFEYGWIDWDGVSSQAFEVHGLIAQKWNALGLVPGYGHPTSDQTADEVNGDYNFFSDGGTILWKSGATAAYEVHGIIRNLYNGEGDEYGDLGFPISDQQVSGNTYTSYFEHGFIQWLSNNNDTILHVTNSKYVFTDPAMTFGGGDPVGSSSPLSLTLHSNGAYVFSGGFHTSSDVDPETVNTIMTATGANGTTFTFQRTSHLNITSRTDNWTISGTNASIASNWAQLEGGTKFDVSGSTSLDLGSLWSAVKSAIGYVGTVIEVVGELD